MIVTKTAIAELFAVYPVLGFDMFQIGFTDCWVGLGKNQLSWYTLVKMAKLERTKRRFQRFKYQVRENICSEILPVP